MLPTPSREGKARTAQIGRRPEARVERVIRSRPDQSDVPKDGLSIYDPSRHKDPLCLCPKSVALFQEGCDGHAIGGSLQNASYVLHEQTCNKDFAPNVQILSI